MTFFILIGLGLAAGCLVFHSLRKEAQEGKCAHCPSAKNCPLTSK